MKTTTFKKMCKLSSLPMLMLITLVLLQKSGFSQTRTVFLYGSIDSTMNGHGNQITIKTYSRYLRPRRTLDVKTTVIPLKEGTFHAPLPCSGNVLYLQFELEGLEGKIKEMVFFLHDPDTLTATISKDKIHFSGKHASELNAQWMVYDADDWNRHASTEEGKALLANRKSLRNRRVSDSVGFYLNQLRASAMGPDFIYNKRLQALKVWRDEINAEDYRTLALFCQAERNSKLMRISESSTSDSYRKAKSRFADSLIAKITQPITDCALYIKTPGAAEMLFDLAVFTLRNNGKVPARSLSFDTLYRYISALYKSDLKDKVLLCALAADKNYHFSGLAQYEDLLADHSVSPETGDAIRAFFNAKMNGRKALPLSLPDTTGKMYSLEDFKGKLVVMDFWFKGCIPCRNLNMAMKPVYDAFDGDSKVIFLNINIDKKKADWLECLNAPQAERSGYNYLHKNSVNVTAAPLGFLHPVIQAYSITGAPALILVSPSGTIVDASPPVPVLNNPEPGKLLLEIIRHNLPR